MEEMSIHFSPEDVNETLGELERNYQEFLEISDSFLGWLLTLNEEEFSYVYRNMTHNFNQDPDGAVGLLFTQIELIHNETPFALFSEMRDDTAKKIQMVRRIKSVKDGYLTYEAGRTDLEWTFDLTKKGIEIISLAETLVEVELINMYKDEEEGSENDIATDPDTVGDDGAGE